jgi:hypothetical protein
MKRNSNKSQKQLIVMVEVMDEIISLYLMDWSKDCGEDLSTPLDCDG